MKIQEVWFLSGLPASGKSSWAKQKIEEDRKKGIINKRVNKDDLRAMLDNSVHSKERESFVLATRDMIIEGALEMGHDVIVDDTNFHPKHLERIKEIVENYRNLHKEAHVSIEEKFFDTPLAECIRRDRNRENPVGSAVIKDMYNKYLAKENISTIEKDPNKMNCIVVDIDGTLAIRGNRSPYEYWKAHKDELNIPVANLVHDLQQANPKLVTVVVTARENMANEAGWTVSDMTQRWLRDNHVHFDEIHIREFGDKRPDWKVKEDIYNIFIGHHYNVLYWIDDRKQVIDHMRSLGLAVLDVAGHEF